MFFSNFESKWPNDFEGLWPPISIPTKRGPRCIFGANLVILVQICDELSHREAEFPIIVSQNDQNDPKGQGQWPLFSIPAKNNPWCMLGANLMILAQICDKVSCGPSKVYPQTDRRTDADNDNTHSAWNAGVKNVVVWLMHILLPHFISAAQL